MAEGLTPAQKTFSSGLQPRPESDEVVPAPEFDEIAPIHEALEAAIEAHTSARLLPQKRLARVRSSVAAWTDYAEAWVAEDPVLRSRWVESWLWGCEFKLMDVAALADARARREQEAYSLWWESCLTLWSRYASDDDKQLRRETKWWVTPFSRGNYDLYLSGFRRGSFPAAMPGIRQLLSQLLGWDELEAEAIATRVAHIGPQLVASRISESDALSFKTELDGAMRFKIKVVGSVPDPDARGGRLPIPEHVRHEIWRRDEGRCVDCGSRERLEYDHIIPVSRGGSNTARNIELRCEACNRKKGAKV